MATAWSQPITRRSLLSIALIAIPLLAATLGWLGIQAYASAHPGHLVIVTDGDGATHELPLDQDSTTIITTTLGTNTVVVEGGRVHVEEADCPGGDCVAHDPIAHVGETIICLPNHLVVTISDAQGSTTPAFDTIVR
jgi:hypothetical protein